MCVHCRKDSAGQEAEKMRRETEAIRLTLGKPIGKREIPLESVVTKARRSHAAKFFDAASLRK